MIEKNDQLADTKATALLQIKKRMKKVNDYEKLLLRRAA